jgi:hypothetical protein
LSIEKRSGQLLAKLEQIRDARSDLIQLNTNTVKEAAIAASVCNCSNQ